MTKCPWGLHWRNPLGQEDIHIQCRKATHLPDDGRHEGLLQQTAITWMQGDRRGVDDQFPGWCSEPRCVLPAGHLGGCAR